MKLHLLAYCAIQLFLQTTSAEPKDKAWIEVRSSHFRVLTGCGAEDARHVAGEMEQMRYVFASKLANVRIESGAPLAVYVTCDDDMFKKLIPEFKGNFAGLFFNGQQKQFA